MLVTTASAKRKPPLSVLSSAFLDAAAHGVTITVIPFAVADMGGPDYMIGVIFALAGLISLVISPLVGALCDRYSQRGILISGSVLTVLALLCFAGSTSLWWLIIYAVLNGFAASKLVALRAYTVSRSYSADWSEAIGRLGAAYGLGFMIGPALGGLFSFLFTATDNPDQTTGAVVIGTGLALISLGISFYFSKENRHPDKPSAKQKNTTTAPRQSKRAHALPLLPTFAALFAVGFTFGTYTAAMANYMHYFFQWKALAVGVLFTVCAMFMAVSEGFIAPKLATRFQPIRTTFIAGVLAVLVLATIPWITLAFWVVGVLILTALFLGIIYTLQTTQILARTAKQHQGRALGLGHSVFLAGQVGGNILAGSAMAFFKNI